MGKPYNLTRFWVSMERSLLQEFDRLCLGSDYANRSEAVRDLIRNLLIERALREENSDGAGTLTLIYNHDQRDLEEKLAEYQHRHLNAIISTPHVHLSRHICRRAEDRSTIVYFVLH
jgi:CopG family nickel-responsive transcriptional regulator